MKSSWHTIRQCGLCFLWFFIDLLQPLCISVTDFHWIASIFLLSGLSHQLGQSTETVDEWNYSKKPTLRGFILDMLWWIQLVAWQAGTAECKARFDIISFVYDWIGGILTKWTQSKMFWSYGERVTHGWAQCWQSRDVLLPTFRFHWRRKRSNIWRKIYFFPFNKLK